MAECQSFKCYPKLHYMKNCNTFKYQNQALFEKTYFIMRLINLPYKKSYIYIMILNVINVQCIFICGFIDKNCSKCEIIIIGFCLKCRTYLCVVLYKLLGIEIYIYKYSRYYKIVHKNYNLLEKKVCCIYNAEIFLRHNVDKFMNW